MYCTHGHFEIFIRMWTLALLLLTILVTIRGRFSTLKRVTTYISANIGQDRPNAFALLFVEAHLVLEINYDDIMDCFTPNSQEKEIFRLINI